MRRVMNISDAYSLALHATALLAADGGKPATNHYMATVLGVSENHLSKVLQRLARAGVLSSARGPGGGFSLNKPADAITLLELYEIVEGPLETEACLLDKKVCAGKGCIFDGLLEKVNREFGEYLRETTVSDIGATMGSD